MTSAELDRQCTAERQPDHMRIAQREAVDEAGEAVGVARHAEPLRRIR